MTGTAKMAPSPEINPEEQAVDQSDKKVDGSPTNGRENVKNLLDMSESGELGTELSDPSGNGVEPTVDTGFSEGKEGSLGLVATVVKIPPAKDPNGSSDESQTIQREESRDETKKASSTAENQSNSMKEKVTDEIDASILMELQEKLQSEMALKAEAENKLRLAQKQVADLQSHGQEQTAEFEKYRGLQETLQEVMNEKEEVETNLASALERIATLEEENSSQLEQIKVLENTVSSNKATLDDQEQELQRIREQRDEQERKEMSLTNRLNAAKKKEAGKTNEAEKYEEELKVVTKELDEAKEQIEELSNTKQTLEKELEGTIVSSRHRQVQTESALAEERKLNEERKQKMKIFIEKKSEELRQAKADNESLQVELNQTSKSLSDLNIRWKQLHAQWVQSQTRNRELQREFHRIKKDSENLHKFGDTLEMKLSKSATETEEHKNKRMAAKNELMEVLRTLETEREVSARLRDSIKFTFTPKALSQQQLLNESLADFETQLVKLSLRLRKPLPPGPDETEGSNSNDDTNNDDGWIESMDDDDGNADSNGANGSGFNRSDRETHRLIEKLNRETQQVSKCIMTIVGGIERMNLMLENSADRSCYSVLSDFLATTGAADAAGRHDEQFTSITSRHYHN